MRMKQQRGGTFLGVIIGLIVGLGLALMVAVYIAKVPVPFMNKGQSRSADQNEAEARKNKDWDPNAPLYGKNTGKPVAAASVTSTPAAAATPPTPVVQAAKSEPKSDAKADAKSVAKADMKAEPKPDTKPDSKAESKPEAKSTTKPETKPAVSADPLGDLAKAKSTPSPTTNDPFAYFVQLGAYRSQEDAEAQRAKLSLTGIETKITEREQSGRTVFRVRTGPYGNKDEAERIKEKLDNAGLETALVRVQR
jgi:cell division protein FtsN